MAVENFRTSVGRIVWGHPGKAKVKKYGDGPQKGQTMMKDGVPINEWSWGVAFPKAEFNQVIYPVMYQEALSGFPNGVPQNFSWKITDGDGIDSNGRPFNQRDGYAGCFILAVNTQAFAPPIYKFENGSYRQITESEIKCGDFVSMNLNFKLNIPQDRTRKPGLYVNPNGVELVGYGAEILSATSDPNEMFGGQRHQLPPGASATPLSSAPANVMMPGMSAAPQAYAAPVAPMMAPAPMAAPQAYAAAPQAPTMAPQPYAAPQAPMPPPAHDFVHNAGMAAPQAPAAPQSFGQPPQFGMPGIPPAR